MVTVFFSDLVVTMADVVLRTKKSYTQALGHAVKGCLESN
jgi:hypothetical protein